MDSHRRPSASASLGLREWTPETGLLSKIPEKAQRGFTTLDLSLTCLAVLPDYLAVGTNVGLIYWYDRKRDYLERLKIEGSPSPVSCISLVHTLDYMVAAGNRDGIITIFQIPHAKDILASETGYTSTDQKKAQIFTVRDMHKHTITTLEWSSNGMKLFSGDTSGVIVGTEMDFFQCQSKSIQLLDEKHEVVQLSYLHSNLLISTTIRSIIYSTDTQEVKKIGTQERKILGAFGAIFEPGLWSRKHRIYTIRPGLRIWVAGQDGSVQNTLIFKDLAVKSHPSIPVINTSIVQPQALEQDIQFGCVQNFMNKYLVTWYKNVLFVIDPTNIEIVGVCHELKSIQGVAVHGDEIFVLETERHIVRISDRMDDLSTTSKDYTLPESLRKGVPDLLTSSFTYPGKISGKPLNFLATKIKETSRAIPKFNSTVLNTIKNVMESDISIRDGQFTVLPQIIPLHDSDIPNITVEPSLELREGVTNVEEDEDVPSTSIIPRSCEIEKFDKISQEIYEEVLLTQYKPEKRKTRKKTKFTQLGSDALTDSTSVNSQYSSTSESDITAPEPKSSMDSSTSNSNTAFSFSSTTTVVPLVGNEVRADVHDLQSKEFMLAKLLNWSELLPNYNGPDPNPQNESSSKGFKPEGEASFSGASNGLLQFPTPYTLYNELECIDTGIRRANREIELSHALEVGVCSVSESRTTNNALTISEPDENKSSIYDSESEHQLDSSLDIYSKYEKYPDSSRNSMFDFGPPSGSSNLNLAEGISTSLVGKMSYTYDRETEFREPISLQEQIVRMSVHDLKAEGIIGNDHWIQYKLPMTVTAIASCERYIVCSDYQNKVYYSTFANLSLQWVMTDYSARQMSVSSDGSLVWRIDENGDLFTLQSPDRIGPFSVDGGWELVCEQVKCCALNQHTGWTVKSNDSVYMCRFENNVSVPRFELIHTPWIVAQIHAGDCGIWALSTDGRVIYRSGIVAECAQGDLWNELRLSIPPIASICLGPSNSVFLADVHNNIHFIDGVTPKAPSGNFIWNITISDYIFTTIPEVSSPMSHLKRLTEPFRSGFLQSRSSIPLLAASDSYVWFTVQGVKSIYVNKTCSTGHRWEPVSVEGAFKARKWSQVYAGSIYRDHGLLWLSDLKGKLCFLTRNGKIEALDLPCSDDVAHIAPAPEALWILTSKGDIYARCNINASNDLGNGWDIIQLSALDNVRLVHVSCGSDVSWACDSKGLVYIRSGSLSPPSATDMSPAWIQVEGSPTCSAESTFIKVYVGTNGRMVWALDNKRNIYAREAIFPELPIGTAWVLVPSIEAVSLAISDSSVWALSPKGEIFRRSGISQTNFVGDYWCKIPGNVKILTVSVCDSVWALDGNGCLIKHSSETLQFCKNSAERTKSLDSEDVDWELLG